MPRPSELQRYMMCCLAQGRGLFENCRGRSEHGGRERAIKALVRHGLIRREQYLAEYELTSLGASWAESDIHKGTFSGGK
jgi:hypothetical protein